MEMVNGWTGRDACALQSALRMSNQQFASHLQIGLRTVADWHDKPDMRPRPETQQLLDTALAQALPEARRRFAALTGQSGPDSAAPGQAGAPGGQAAAGLRAAETSQRMVNTGDYAVVDARTIHLPHGAATSPARVAAARGLHNLPAPANPVFVDRLDDMAQLDAAMSQDPPAAAPVVHGLGGMGKSTLALHFAHRNRERYNPVWWIPADTAVSITSGLAELAARLTPYGEMAGKNTAEAAAWAVTWLQAHTGWLLVFDDAPSAHSIESVLGPLTGGRHLITSRRATGWHRLGSLLPLAPLPPDAALEMLMQIIGPGPDDQPGRELLESISAELGYLPLALDQAAAYIQRTAITPDAYLDRLRRYPGRMFATSAPAEDADESAGQRTIARTWQLSLQAVTAEEPAAGDMLRALAWYAPDPIPRELTYRLHDDPLTVDDALGALNAYGMLTLTSGAVTVHRLVQAVARIPDHAAPDRTPGMVTQARYRAEQAMLEALPANPLFNVPTWPRWRQLIPHVIALADYIPPGQDSAVTADILLAASGFLQGDGHYDQAIEFAARSADTRRRLQGPDAPETLQARSFLASAHRAAGELATATPMHELNLADCERVLGPDHPDTLVARSNLAYLYAIQDQTGRALELNKRNLADYERVHGPDHPHTLNARANLASSHRAAGDLTRAIELHQQSVADYARVLGPDHSETITARSNLAYAYQLAGDLPRAIELHRQVLAARENLYGIDHRFTELSRELLTAAEQQATEQQPPNADE